MGSQYAGNGTLFPTDFTIPDDGDPEIAASINVALEALGDRTAYLRAIGMKSKTFTVDGTWNSPANCGAIGVVDLMSGGGGGGGANPSSTASTSSASGGGGGAMGSRKLVFVALTPSTAYAVDVGAGGSGGAAGNPGGAGSRSSFDHPNAYVNGGRGGSGSSATVASGQRLQRGGTVCAVGFDFSTRVTGDLTTSLLDPSPGAGGAGVNAITEVSSAFGNQSDQGYNGAGANCGTTVGGYLGGGAGGGGGGGHTANAGTGGAGGNGNNAGTGGAGTAGGAAPANSGGGGGGGGAGGQGSAAGGAAGAGGAGGSGKVTIYYFGDAT